MTRFFPAFWYTGFSLTCHKRRKWCTMQKSVRLVYLLLVLVAFSWGGAFTAAKLALRELPPFSVATLRFALASLILMAILWKQEGFTNKIQRNDYYWLLLLGLTGIFGYNALFFEALKHTTAVNGALIIAANPMATAILSTLLTREKLTKQQVVGILVSFTGVLFVIAKGSLSVVRDLSFNFGDLLLVGAMLCWAVYSIAGKRVMGKFSPLAATTFACIIGTLALAPFMVREIMLAQWNNPTWLSWSAIIYMAVFASVMGFVWWNQGVAQIGASRAAVFINLVPIAAMSIAAVSGEAITLPQFLGAVLVISGVYLTSVKRANAEPVQEGTTAPKTIQS